MLVGQSPLGWQADEVTITDNSIHACGSDPTRDLLPSDNVIEYNVISYTKNAGIEGWGGSNNLVRSNCLWQNARGAFSGSRLHSERQHARTGSALTEPCTITDCRPAAPARGRGPDSHRPREQGRQGEARPVAMSRAPPTLRA
jgi:parallel beta-helix repeat protein